MKKYKFVYHTLLKLTGWSEIGKKLDETPMFLRKGTPTWDELQIQHGVQLDRFYLQKCVKNEIGK